MKARDSKYYAELGRRTKGIKNRFRKRKSWEVVNHDLYDYLVANNLGTDEFSKMIGKDTRRVQSYIYEGSVPRYKEDRENIARIIGIDVNILWKERLTNDK